MANVVSLAVLAACAAALCGLLAIWAALGRGHWFVRAAVVAATIGMLLPVPAFDLAIVFLSQSLVIVVPLLLFEAVRSAKRRNNTNPPEETESAASGHRFALVDLFLLTLVAAGVASLGAYLPAKHRDFWPSYVMIGAGAGVVSLAAAWAALGRRWPWLRWALLMAVPPSVGFGLRAVQLPDGLDQAFFEATDFANLQPSSPIWFSPSATCSSALVIVASLVLLKLGSWLAFFSRRRSATFASGESERTWKRFLSRTGAVLVPGAASIAVGAAYFKLVCVLPIPRIEAPDPNGYAVLAKLGSELEHADILTGDPLSEAELREFVDADRDRLAAARAALALPHVVPVDYGSAELLSFESMHGIRQLARAFQGEGKLAVYENRPDDAVAYGLDAMRLGRIAARGGLLVDWLVGGAVEGIGLHQLCDVRESISPETRRRLIETLQRLDAERESAQDMLKREKTWQQHAFGWAGRLWPDTESMSPEAAEDLANVRSANTRLLICDLAVRLYLADRGQPPERLEQVVPEYLPELPDDPFTGQPLIYRPQGVSYLLYSIGADRKDDGGTPIEYGWVGDGDLLLDPPEAAVEMP